MMRAHGDSLLTGLLREAVHWGEQSSRGEDRFREAGYWACFDASNFWKALSEARAHVRRKRKRRIPDPLRTDVAGLIPAARGADGWPEALELVKAALGQSIGNDRKGGSHDEA